MALLSRVLRLAAAVFIFGLISLTALATDKVTTEGGILQGTTNADHTVRIFKGIPFAAPPGEICGGKPRNPQRSGREPAKPINTARLVCRLMFLAISTSATVNRVKTVSISLFGLLPKAKPGICRCWSGSTAEDSWRARTASLATTEKSSRAKASSSSNPIIAWVSLASSPTRS